MKIAILSDIHGNLEAFLSVLDDIDRFKADAVVSLGDNIGYGGDSEAVMDIIISRNIMSVLGNHELACVNKRVYKWYTGDVKKAIDQALSSLSQASLAYLKGLETRLCKFESRFVHGFPPDSVRHYLTQAGDDELHRTLSRQEEALCFVGHTHKVRLVYAEDNTIQIKTPDRDTFDLTTGTKYIVNAGSVGQPRDGDPRAKYMIWDVSNQRLMIRRIPYDTRKAAEKIVAAGLPFKYARAVHPELTP
ncbi:MAG TPA: metallophosphoesterase [Desulfobacteraceae bacterium]|nr:metallophosphoesterase [Desulfobacteraceae bacterium]